ncbi:MAG: AAA family ATPase [Bacteroidales bacterium]|jgi:ATP-dependent exoDNAse (exonuclease V) alpha subunit|nr:AAA family ATPase [Bacteroidales bacterium]
MNFTPDQQKAISKFASFIEADKSKAFILKGYAGTGKTTLVKEFIRILNSENKPFALLASTGRAAKILSNLSGADTSTVHSKIYTYNDFNQDLETIAKNREATNIDRTGQLYLTFELIPVQSDTACFYIVDEASMVGDKKEKSAVQALFGSGRLLMDLLTYDPKGKFIFVGDICQLPPVQEEISPALSAEYLQSMYQIESVQVELTKIVRQSDTNDIIVASYNIRKLYFDCPANNTFTNWAKFPLRGYKNIEIFNDQASMLKDYVTRIKDGGYNQATLICRSNKSCNTLTSLIRPSLGLTSPVLQKGDLLLITQNNLISGLMNGDMVEVVGLGPREKRANLTFLRVDVKELVTNKIYSQLLIEEVVYQGAINLTPEQQKELFMDYFYRMRKKGIGQKHPSFKEGLRMDSYLNALRAVYGFAITCHKAQGGEWEHVYLDIPGLRDEPSSYQWLYTAVTRAKTQLNVSTASYRLY